MLLKAPFLLPPDLRPRFRPQLGRRFVAIFWEPVEGEKDSHEEGHACGLCDNWPLDELVRRPEVKAWLDENGIHLGNSDEEARHWLVVDVQTREVYAVPSDDALTILLRQSLPE
jgi:hypothetical protein